MGMRRRELLLAAALLSSACGPKPLPAPPAAPRVTGAADFIPADLDVLARLDMAQVRAALGAVAIASLSRELSARQAGTENQETGQTEPLLLESLLDADVVYLAYRPSPALLPLDRVLVVQGHFAPIIKAPQGFSGGTDLGGDVRRWERERTQPLARSSTARLYALGDRVRAFVSEAELDSVDRALEGLSEPRLLVAPEEGALSLATRPRLLAPWVNGTLRELLQDSKSLELVVDLQSDGAVLRGVLATSSPDQAQQLVRAGQKVLEVARGGRGQPAELLALDSRATLKLRLDRSELGALLGRVRGN